MNCLIAPDKFKSSLSAMQVCDAIATGLRRFDPHVKTTAIPLADGGEGTLEILDHYLDLETISLSVSDPIFRPVKASYKLSGKRAYIEMAQASGLDLLTTEERNCLQTSSLGTGELIRDAIQRGASEIYLFIGGSATCDAGLGVLHSLGIKAMGEDQILPPIGASLPLITALDASGLQIDAQQLLFTVVCDVRNPLFGPKGAAFVYGPQKGANEAGVLLLDQGLRNFAQVIERQNNKVVYEFEGSGAAGGIAAGIKAFFPTKIRRGIDTILDLVDLTTALSKADLVISGEGKLDDQTLEGKVVAGVQNLCTKAGKKLAIICGSSSLTEKQIKQLGFWKVYPLVREDTSLETAMEKASELVSHRAYQLISEISA